ncbi:MAG: VOC family protein, partial [Actinomycetota bacterium]
MPEMKTYPSGTPAWVDLRTTDVEDARRFYAGLFGWTVDPPTPEHHDSTAGMIRDRMVAGIGPLDNRAEAPAWMTYIAVDNAEDTAKKAIAAGASVVQELTDVAGAGRVAAFLDPTGAPFGIWQAVDHSFAELVNEPNTLCWNELTTRDIDTARDFYRTVFGWDVRTNPF